MKLKLFTILFIWIIRILVQKKTFTKHLFQNNTAMLNWDFFMLGATTLCYVQDHNSLSIVILTWSAVEPMERVFFTGPGGPSTNCRLFER